MPPSHLVHRLILIQAISLQRHLLGGESPVDVSVGQLPVLSPTTTY